MNSKYGIDISYTNLSVDNISEGARAMTEVEGELLIFIISSY